MSIVIRKATPKDLGEVIELWKSYEDFEDSLINPGKFLFVKKRKNAEKNMRANFLRVIKSKKAEIIVAEDNNKIVGFILISKSRHDDIHNFNFYGGIHYLYVKPEYRGKKIASNLFESSKKWFKQKGIKYMNLDVNLKNKKAREIYGKWNFLEYEIGMWGKLK